MRHVDVTDMMGRARQLNTLASAIIVSLLAMIAILVFSLITGVRLPDSWVFGDHIVRILFFGLVLMVVLYMTDQHRQLHSAYLEDHARLEQARQDLLAAYDRLSFALHTASVMASLSSPDALETVLDDIVTHFDADAAAVVGDEVRLRASSTTDPGLAETSIVHVALNAVAAGRTLSTDGDPQYGSALAVPLRIRESLSSVLCVWRGREPFTTDQREGLMLVARIIELSLENRLLLKDLTDQVDGTLALISELIDARMPEYARHSANVAELAVEVGQVIGLKPAELADLRTAALIADIGVLTVPETALSSPENATEAELLAFRIHPEAGARAAARANFSTWVQEAVRAHHELMDGTGYPRGLRGTQIHVGGRILAACADFDTMRAVGGNGVGTAAALRELARGAGSRYDAEVVRVLADVVRGNAVASGPATPQAADDLEGARTGA